MSDVIRNAEDACALCVTRLRISWSNANVDILLKIKSWDISCDWWHVRKNSWKGRGQDRVGASPERARWWEDGGNRFSTFFPEYEFWHRNVWITVSTRYLSESKIELTVSINPSSILVALFLCTVHFLKKKTISGMSDKVNDNLAYKLSVKDAIVIVLFLRKESTNMISLQVHLYFSRS